MELYNLDRIFQPETVAVIGANEKENTIGNALMTNLKTGGFTGKILPVNLKYSNIHGFESRPTVSEIKEPVDLAILATPTSTIPEIIDKSLKHIQDLLKAEFFFTIGLSDFFEFSLNSLLDCNQG